MLILTRKADEQVLIDKGTIQMKVLEVKGGQVRIGFIAPAHIDIDREETYLKKMAQKNELIRRETREFKSRLMTRLKLSKKIFKKDAP